MWKYIGTKECNDFLLSLNLFNCNDEKKYIKTLYSISNNIEKNYKIYKIRKRNGKYRTIYEPNSLLKHIQKQILLNILNNKSISKYAKAYHKGISLKDNAIPHINKNIILKLDIKDFFENISFVDIYNSCFPIEYFPKSVGMLLTYLCTYDEHLTQGSPTSAYISNLVMKDFDEVLGAWCEDKNISYTRYSDDMTFSGSFNPNEIIKKVRKMLYKLGLQLNNNKIHVVSKSSNQNVTGIVVNEKVKIRRIGVYLGNLNKDKIVQLNLFKENKTDEELNRTLNYIKCKYGKNSILRAVSFQMDSLQKTRNVLIGGHNAE